MTVPHLRSDVGTGRFLASRRASIQCAPPQDLPTSERAFLAQLDRLFAAVSSEFSDLRESTQVDVSFEVWDSTLLQSVVHFRH